MIVVSTYHEPADRLPEATQDLHRALQSLVEEIQAIDWYSQRIAVSPDESLKEVLDHSRSEEIEHAANTLKWLMQNDKGFQSTFQEIIFGND